eukprot:208523-Prymnesium_polylepis.1
MTRMGGGDNTMHDRMNEHGASGDESGDATTDEALFAALMNSQGEPDFVFDIDQPPEKGDSEAYATSWFREDARRGGKCKCGDLPGHTAS